MKEKTSCHPANGGRKYKTRLARTGLSAAGLLRARGETSALPGSARPETAGKRFRKSLALAFAPTQALGENWPRRGSAGWRHRARGPGVLFAFARDWKRPV